MSLLMVILITSVISFFSIGLGYFLFLKLSTKKQTWKAKVYQMSEGVKPPLRDNKGNILSTIELHDLIPFCEDIIEKIDREHGCTVYRLQKINKSVNEVTADIVENWGPGKREVCVLLQDNTATLLKRGYDNNGRMIFEPLPREDIELIKSDMAIHKEKIRAQKNVWAAIAPYITIVASLITLVAAIYIISSAFIELGEQIQDSTALLSDNLVQASKLNKDAIVTSAAIMGKGQTSLGLQPNEQIPAELIPENT